MSGNSTDDKSGPLKVLSAGAPKTGVSRCAEAFFRQTGQRVEIDFATAPVLRSRVAQGEAEADVVVAPLPVLQEFEASGRALPDRATLIGAIRTGVVVRAGAPLPDLSSVAAFTQALLAADSLVYNQASSGLYVARLMARLGIAEAVEAKTARLPTGAAVMEHVARSRATRELGFGQITEIRRHLELGLELAGPLPDEIGKATVYAAGLLVNACRPAAAGAMLRFMASAEGREIFTAAGLEQHRRPPP